MSKTIAAIDLGSNSIRLTIFDDTGNNQPTILDSLTQPLRLGKDTFVLSAIRKQHFHDAVEILDGFKRVMAEYDVSKVIAVATSAVREADNGLDFIDFLHNMTGIAFNILEDTEETSIIFTALQAEIGKNSKYLNGNTLVIELGSGNIKTVFIKDGLISFSQVHKIGALRVQEILRDINVKQHKFELVLREFIRSDVLLLRSELPKEPLDRFIVIGGLVPEILSYITTDTLRAKKEISTPALLKILGKYRELSLFQFSKELNLSAEKADVLLPSLLIFSDFLEVFVPENVLLSNTSLTDGLILSRTSPDNDFEHHVMASAKYLGQKYNNDDQHSQVVHDLAISIFNKTKEIHNLKRNDLLVLRVAAWLHDIGRYVNGREHHKHSEYLIANASLPGLTKKQLSMAAVVARNHRRFQIKYGENLDTAFSPKDQLRIRKLSAILRLANALHLGREDSAEKVQIKFSKKKKILAFEIHVSRDITLEEWGFNPAKVLFENLFSIDCQWKLKE